MLFKTTSSTNCLNLDSLRSHYWENNSNANSLFVSYLRKYKQWGRTLRQGEERVNEGYIIKQVIFVGNWSLNYQRNFKVVSQGVTELGCSHISENQLLVKYWFGKSLILCDISFAMHKGYLVFKSQRLTLRQRDWDVSCWKSEKMHQNDEAERIKAGQQKHLWHYTVAFCHKKIIQRS